MIGNRENTNDAATRESVPTGPRRATTALPWITALALASMAAGCSASSGADAGADTPGDDDGSSATDDGGSVTPVGDDGDDATMSPGAGDSGSPGVTPGVDGGPDASPAPPKTDAAPVGCVSSLFESYVQRADGALLYEGSAEEPVLDSTTGLPLTGIKNVQSGIYHGCAAITGGGAQCWQVDATSGNVDGQLGNGTTAASTTLWRSSPVVSAASTPLTNVVRVATGVSSSACAVTSDGKLWCWGDLTWLVNNGTKLLSGYAQTITTDGMNALTGVIDATIGAQSACALVQGTPNSVWCWGSNSSGEAAQGDTKSRQYPTKVLGLSNPTKVLIAGSYYGPAVCAQDGDGVRCWGQNYQGQVGGNTATYPILAPTAVVSMNGTSLGGVTALAEGDSAFSVLRSDGTMWTWGTSTTKYAANYGITNIVAIGWAGGSGGNAGNAVRYLTSDGIYHSAMTTINVKCGSL